MRGTAEQVAEKHGVAGRFQGDEPSDQRDHLEGPKTAESIAEIFVHGPRQHEELGELCST